MSTQVRRQTALTRVDLLVMMIVVIVLLVGLLMPSVSSCREAERRFACINKLRRLGMATHAYHDAHGCFPPMRCGTDRSTHIDDNDVNVVCCDGAIRQIAENIDLRTWWGLGTRDSGETLGEF